MAQAETEIEGAGPQPAGGNPSESGKLSKSTAKRRRILEAAATVFRRRGYAQATLSEIASEAGTQAGSLYYYFESRDDLVAEVLAFATTRIRERVDEALAALPPGADALDRLIAMVRAHCYTTLDRDDFSIAYHKVYDQVPDAVRDRVARAPRAYGRFWAEVFDAAVAAGFIRRDLDARLARLLVIGSMSWMGDWYKRDGHSTPEQIADTLLSLFLQGAAADPQLATGRMTPRVPAPHRRWS